MLENDISTNSKNIIAVVRLQDNDKILYEFFLSKTGTLWDVIDGDLVFVSEKNVLDTLGRDGKELLDMYNDDAFEVYVRGKGLIVINDKIISQVLVAKDFQGGF